MADDKSYTYRLRYVRISPRKLRYVVDLIRGKYVNSADSTLKFCNKRGAPMCRKLLLSAIAGTSELADKRRTDLDVNKLYVHEIRVDSGPTHPRFTRRTKPGFRRPYLIRKRWSHLILVLKERKEEKEPTPESKAVQAKAPEKETKKEVKTKKIKTADKK